MRRDHKGKVCRIMRYKLLNKKAAYFEVRRNGQLWHTLINFIIALEPRHHQISFNV